MKHSINTVGDNDLTVINMPNTILPGETEYCFQLLALHDEIVEGDEDYIVFIMSANSSDRVNGSISVIISDNDGEFYGHNN